MKELIELAGITKTYSEGENVITTALSSVTLAIHEKEFVSIMGPSGSGKSTLMHIMGLLDRPTTGSYKFSGRDVEYLTDDELAQIRNQKIGFVFQSFNLLPKTTVLENVKLPLLYSGANKKSMDQIAKLAVESVGLKDRTYHYSNQLSGGEKQRVAMARALVNNPAVIFADEPTGNLDSKSGYAIMSLLHELNDKGHVIVLVTHELSAAKWAERLITIRDGKIESDQPVKDRYTPENTNHTLMK